MAREEEIAQQADGLEICLHLLSNYVRCLRGEEMDMTGRGLWDVFVGNLEEAGQVRVITEEQYQAFVELDRKARGEG